MKAFLFFVLLSTQAFAAGEPCSGSFTIAPSDDGGFVFSGNVTEGTYNSPRTSFHDDDGFLSLAATNAQIFSSNNVYSGNVTNYRVSDAEKRQIVRSLEAQITYNAGAVQSLRDAAAQNITQPDGAPTIEQVEALTREATALLTFVRGVRTNVSAASWNANVGKYINQGLRANRVYDSLLPGINGQTYQISPCGHLVRCLCNGNQSPFLRSRLCSINYEDPKPDTGEYARCSYFNVTAGPEGSSGGNTNQNGNTSRTQAQ